MAETPRTVPTTTYRVPQQEIPNSVLTTPQLQRAWCLMITRAIWPTIDPSTAWQIAAWLNGSPRT